MIIEPIPEEDQNLPVAFVGTGQSHNHISWFIYLLRDYLGDTKFPGQHRMYIKVSPRDVPFQQQNLSDTYILRTANPGGVGSSCRLVLSWQEFGILKRALETLPDPFFWWTWGIRESFRVREKI